MALFGLCCGIIPFIAGMAVFLNYARDGGVYKNNSSALSTALALTVVPPALILFIDLYILISNYNGLCIGPPDYTAQCTYSEYLNYHLFNGVGAFGYIFLCLLSLGWGGAVFGFIGYYFSRKQ